MKKIKPKPTHSHLSRDCEVVTQWLCITIGQLWWYSFKSASIGHGLFFFFFLYYVFVSLRTVLRNNLYVSQTANTSKTGIIICVYWQVKKCCDSVLTDRFEWFSVTFIIKPSQITPFCARTGKCSHGVQQLSSLILNKSQRWQQKQFRDYITDLISVKQDEEVIYRHWEQARPSGLKLFSNHYSGIYCAFGFECWNSVSVWGQTVCALKWICLCFRYHITSSATKANRDRYSLLLPKIPACDCVSSVNSLVWLFRLNSAFQVQSGTPTPQWRPLILRRRRGCEKDENLWGESHESSW